MKIMTEALRPLIKVWSLMRKQGMRAYEYVYIDFDNAKIKMLDEQSFITANLPLSDYEQHEPVYVEGSKFFSLVNAYDSIEIKSNDTTFYSEDGNTFNLPQLNIIDAAFPEDVYNDWIDQKIDFTAEFNNMLLSSLNYVDPDINSEFSTLYFQSGIAVALSDIKMFFEKLPGITSNFNIPYPLIKIILALRLENSVNFKFRELSNEAMMIEFEYNGVVVRFSSSAKYQLPVDPLDPNFRQQFDHNNYFIVDKNQLNESVNFLGEFLKDVSDVICTCQFVTYDSAGNKLDNPYIRIDSNYSGEISYKIPIKEFSDIDYFNGKKLVLYLNIFKSVITTLSNYKTESILVKYEEGMPAVYFSNAENLKNNVEDNVYIIHTVIDENS